MVGVGASAGGLEALSRFLEGLPVDTGMGFVLLQHLDPKHPSLLTHLLSGKTSLAIAEAVDGDDVAADRIYVVPPGVDVLIDGGRLRLTPRRQTAGLHLPIDGFLRSLAADQGERAIGVILSGAASDGAQGLAAVKSEGGVTFAQEPSTAEYPSMPANAIDARAVDFVLPPGEIGGELARLGAGGAPAARGVAGGAPGNAVDHEQDADALDEVSLCCMPPSGWISRPTSCRRSAAASRDACSCAGLPNWPTTCACCAGSLPRSRPCTATS